MLTRDELVFPLSSAGIGTYEWDVLEAIMRWDAQMYMLFGLERGGFSGKFDDFLSLVDSSDRCRLTQEIAAGLYKGEEFGSEFRIVPSCTTAMRPLEIRFKIRTDAKDKGRYITGLCWDVKECHHIAEALASKQNLLSALMDNLPDLIYFKDRQSRFTGVNRVFLARAGLKNHWHFTRSAKPPFPAIQSGRWFHHAQVRRYGPGPRNRQALSRHHGRSNWNKV